MLAIKNNLMAEQAARQLGLNYNSLSTSVRRLSSGLRIVTAKDDAAGMAVRELIRADVGALRQGSRNARDAISMLQTAEGAVGVVDEILIRLRELAEQSATESYSPAQRSIMDDEFNQLVLEIDRITNNTTFNDLSLLNDELGSGSFDIHLASEEMINIDRADMTASGLGVGGEGANATMDVKVSAFDTEVNYSGTLTWAAGTSLQGFKVTFTSGTNYTLKEVAAKIEASATAANSAVGDNGQELQARVLQVEGGYRIKLENLTTQDSSMALGALTAGSMNANFTTYLSAWTMDGGSDGLSISDEEAAREALDTILTAIKTKDEYRAKLGYMMNRLEAAISVIDIQAENLLAAESRISDVDVAVEMAAMTRAQVLAQAGISMLSQANQMPQMALSLLQQ
jgi:flagellin